MNKLFIIFKKVSLQCEVSALSTVLNLQLDEKNGRILQAVYKLQHASTSYEISRSYFPLNDHTAPSKRKHQITREGKRAGIQGCE